MTIIHIDDGIPSDSISDYRAYDKSTDTLKVTSGGSSVAASAYESKTITDTSAGLTSGTYGTATMAEITLESGQIRIRKDGTDPTAGEGHLIEIGDIIILENAADIANFKAIRTGAVSGVLKVTYSE